MKNLNRWEIANHLHTSVKETYPFDRDLPVVGPRGGKSTSSVEFPSRNHNSPDSHTRDNRNFTQSLWGRR